MIPVRSSGMLSSSAEKLLHHTEEETTTDSARSPTATAAETKTATSAVQGRSGRSSEKEHSEKHSNATFVFFLWEVHVNILRRKRQSPTTGTCTASRRASKTAGNVWACAERRGLRPQGQLFRFHSPRIVRPAPKQSAGIQGALRGAERPSGRF